MLEAQVRRMLKDSRAKALADNFAGQWLTLRRLSQCGAGAAAVPGVEQRSAPGDAQETELFFQEVVKQDRSILDFLDGRFTYLNERLAKLYGSRGSRARSSSG